MANFETKICKCGKTFRTANGSALCYWCHLSDITGDSPPEEGDFNTAHRAGDLDDRNRRLMQDDLAAVELGFSSGDSMRGFSGYSEEDNEDYNPLLDHDEVPDDWSDVGFVPDDEDPA
ncbi:MAG TPA: hypothetical protein VK338_02490 [Candidatus Nitrosocosmicus sp.]|nr:hypothetical protein [Candidatus Nitrosocosmicus sp.]